MVESARSVSAGPIPPSGPGGPLAVTPGGLAPAAWDVRIDSAPALTAAELPGPVDGPVRLVLAAAHPDDETIGAGRLAYTWATDRGPVSAVLATAGEACVDHVATRPEGLAQRRLGEWQAATEALGVRERVVLHLPDGQLEALQDEVRSALDEVVRGHLDRAERVVLAAPWRFDPHPDHAAIGRATRDVGTARGVPVLAYPVWTTYWTDPDDPEARRAGLWRVRTGRAADLAHARAIRCFVSQLEPLAPELGPVVPEAMLAHHRRQLLLSDEPGRPW